MLAKLLGEGFECVPTPLVSLPRSAPSLSLFPLHLLCLFSLWFSVNPSKYQMSLSYQGRKYQQQAARAYSILCLFSLL